MIPLDLQPTVTIFIRRVARDFPSSLEMRALCFHYTGHMLGPWSGN